MESAVGGGASATFVARARGNMFYAERETHAAPARAPRGEHTREIVSLLLPRVLFAVVTPRHALWHRPLAYPRCCARDTTRLLNGACRQHANARTEQRVR